MKLNNDLLIGVAIGVGVAMLLRPKTAAPTQPYYPTVPDTLPPSSKSSKTRGDVLSGYPTRKNARMGNYITQPGYPMPGWYANQ